jgi:hypothetical protein
MGWLRSKRTGVGWLALFALTCQIVLAYGHVHLGKINGGSGASTTVWSIAAAPVADPDAAAPSSPLQKNPNGLADDFCAICASVSLASTLVVPVAPAIDIPTTSVRALPWWSASTELASLDHFLFNARGPPHA